MFRTLSNKNIETLRLIINGKEHFAAGGSSVWTAMALAGETTTRIAPVSEKPRSAYCAIGVCFECLVKIDGMPNRQACLTEVREGMVVELQTITESSQAILEKGGKPNENHPGSRLVQKVSSHE